MSDSTECSPRDIVNEIRHSSIGLLAGTTGPIFIRHTCIIRKGYTENIKTIRFGEAMIVQVGARGHVQKSTTGV